ncbi:hypothetical protein N2152v2_011217, partial [Parachlorella kessleri]
GDAAQPYDQEFGRLRAEGNPKLGCEVYRPAGCLDLHLEGLATPFSQSAWPRVHSLRFALHEGDAAVDACQAAVQAQGLEVQLDGRTITVPVQPVAARVPPGHATLEMRGVPDDCARHGFTAAVLAAAGYGPGSGAQGM